MTEIRILRWEQPLVLYSQSHHFFAAGPTMQTAAAVFDDLTAALRGDPLLLALPLAGSARVPGGAGVLELTYDVEASARTVGGARSRFLAAVHSAVRPLSEQYGTLRIEQRRVADDAFVVLDAVRAERAAAGWRLVRAGNRVRSPAEAGTTLADPLRRVLLRGPVQAAIQPSLAGRVRR